MLAEAEIFMKLENPCSEPPVCFGGSSHLVMLHLYMCDQSLFEGFIFVFFWRIEVRSVLLSWGGTGAQVALAPLPPVDQITLLG